MFAELMSGGCREGLGCSSAWAVAAGARMYMCVPLGAGVRGVCGGAGFASRGSGGAVGSLARPLPGVPAERLPGCGTPLPGAVRMRQRLHGNAASRASRRPPPAPRSGQEAEPGSPSRPSSQQAGPGGQSLVGGAEEGAPYFSGNERLTCLYFPLCLREAEKGGCPLFICSALSPLLSSPTPTC